MLRRFRKKCGNVHADGGSFWVRRKGWADQMGAVFGKAGMRFSLTLDNCWNSKSIFYSVPAQCESRRAIMRCQDVSARPSGPMLQRQVLRPCRPVAQRLSARQARRSCIVLAAQLDPDNASILVAGGGGVALAVTRRLKDMGSWVWMLQRSETRRSEIEGMMAILVRGDAMSKEDVTKAFDQIEEVDAVVSTIGGTPADPMADSQGNTNLIEAAAAKGVKKFVLVTSIGTGDSKDAPPTQVYDVLKPVLLEKEKAEEALKGSANTGSTMQWTIIRPGGLKSEPATGSGILTEDRSICGAINREDVAELVVKALFSDKTDGKVLAAVDQSQLYGEPKVDVFQP